MKIDLYQVDAFTDKIFGGNPACVVPLLEWLPDDVLLNIARENAVAETAFFIMTGDSIQLRWFTPEIEIDLCGHATLATAHVLKKILNQQTNSFIFSTRSGELTVTVEGDLYSLNFPARMPVIASLPPLISDALNIQPKQVLKSRDYVLVYDSEEDVKNIHINRAVFDQINLDPGGVIVTAKGNDCDFVSRFFTPQASILEDPVTGSAHCSLIPYWTNALGKNELYAKQLSERGGTLYCKNNGDRVIISGYAITFFAGSIFTH
jgi:PhzF family phenazine biosynthesis protein